MFGSLSNRLSHRAMRQANPATGLGCPHARIATALLGLLAACTAPLEPPMATDPADRERCRLQAIVAIPDGGYDPFDVPIKRAEFEKACLQEQAARRGR